MDPLTMMALAGGVGQGASGLLNTFMRSPSERAQTAQQWKLGQLQSRTQKAVANINTAPALGQLALQQQRYGRSNDFLGGLGGIGQGGWLSQMLMGNNDQMGGPDSMGLAQQYAPNENAFGNMFSGAQNQFSPMAPGLFQSQLNGILGGAAGALGGQLRSSKDRKSVV